MTQNNGRVHPAIDAKRNPPSHVRPERPEDRVRPAPGRTDPRLPLAPQDAAELADRVGAHA